MGRLVIFLLMIFVLSIIGIIVWWIWSKVYIAIKRRESVFEIEKETHKQIKKNIQEEKENEN